MQIFLETSRLLLREMTHDDLEGMFEMDSNPKVHLHLDNKPVKTREQSTAIIQNILDQYESNGIGRWSVELKSTGEFIGWCGLKLETNVNGREEFYDIGYRFIERFWGQGYGYESAQACLDYGFEELRYPMICATADKNNIGSNRILTKIGLDQTEEFLYDGRLPAFWYEKANPLL